MSSSASSDTNATSAGKTAPLTKKYTPPVNDDDFQNLITMFEPLDITKAQTLKEEDEAEADLTAAWSDFEDIQRTQEFNAEVKLRRDQSYGELLDQLDSIAVCFRGQQSEPDAQCDEPLARLSPLKLAAAWEKKTWCAEYKIAYDLSGYNEAIAKDVADLQIWIKCWGDCSDGENMFRERFRRDFENQTAGLMSNEEVASRNDVVSVGLGLVDVGQEKAAPLAKLSASEVDFEFAGEPVVFGAASKNE